MDATVSAASITKKRKPNMEKELLTHGQATTIFNFLRIAGHVDYQKVKTLSKDDATKIINEFQWAYGDEGKKCSISQKYGIHSEHIYSFCSK